MKAVWVDAGNDPAYQKIDAAGIKGLFFDPRDPRVTKAYLQAQVAKGYQVGIHLDWNWPGFFDLAAKAGEYMSKLRFGNSGPKVQFDVEIHDPEYILDNLARWRQKFPTQDTSLTVEGMQGGWLTDPDFVAEFLSRRTRLVPQCYWGADGKIEGQWAADAVLRDLTRNGKGFRENVVTLFWDAADLPRGWDGWAFTQGRLP